MPRNRIKGITVEIGGDTTGLDKALKSVNGSIKNTQSSLKDVSRLLKLDPANTELLAQKQRLLKDAIAATSEKLETLKTAQAQAKKQLEEGTLGQDKYDALQREIAETEEGLRSLQKEAAATSGALEKMAAAGGKMQAAGSAIEGAGKKVSIASAAVVGLGATAVKTAGDFDAAMSRVAAITGATGDELDALRDKAREMGEKTKFSASESADAMNYMAMAGWKTEEMLAGLEGMLNLAAASGEDLATTSDIVTDALTAFGLSAKESNHFADVLAAASANANTNVAMMGETFKYVAPVAGALGYTVEDVAEAIGLMANAGIKSSQAGTSLREILTALQGDITLSGKAFGEVSIATANADGSMRELGDIVSDLRVYFSQLTESEAASSAEALVGKRAMSGLLAIMQAGPKDVEKLSSAIEGCDGSAKAMAETMLDNLSGQMVILKSQLEELAISFGEILMPMIRKTVSAVQRFVDKLNNMDEGQRQAILRIGMFVAALGPALVVLGKLVAATGSALKGIAKLAEGAGKLKTAMSGMSGASGALKAALGGISGTTVAVAGGIASLIGAFAHLWKTNDEFREKMTSTWEDIKGAFDGFAQGIVERLNSLGFDFSSITEVLSSAWQGFCDLLAPAFEGAFSAIGTVLSTVLDSILGILDVFAAVFRGDWEGAWNAVEGMFATTWDGMSTIFETACNTLENIANVFLGWFGTSWDEVWGAISTVCAEAWEAVKSAVNAAVEAVTSTIAKIGETITTVWNTITTITTTIWEGIKTSIFSVADAIGTKVGEAFNAIGSAASSIFGGLKETIATIWEGIKEAITGPIDAAKKHVSDALDSIKKFFANCKLSLPKIKLPHFSISGKFSLKPPSVPHLSINWYKEGGIMTDPTAFGVNGASLMAGGEAGAEAILPLKGFYEKLERMLGEKLYTGNMEKYLATIANNSEKCIVLDSGALIGRLAPGMDRQLKVLAVQGGYR